VVDYSYERELNAFVNFKDFVVGSSSMEKVKGQLRKEGEGGRQTVFKIKSVAGRRVNNSVHNLDEVVFMPYSSFQIVHKTQTSSAIEYELEELVFPSTASSFNLLVWVDDKPKEGKIMFDVLKKFQIIYPVYLCQVGSNLEL
jgi:hypothetical protein